MAEQAMEKVDLTTIKEKIEGKIRGMVADLIPDEAWKELVAKEVENFLGPVPKRGGYGDGCPPKVAKEIIREVVQERFKAAIEAELTKPEYAGQMTWNDVTQMNVVEPSEFVSKLIKDNLNAIVQLAVENLSSGIMQRTLETLRSQIQHVP